jgi:Xaa-Pro aminopeptidase
LKECYTRVLLGNLDLEKCVWPETSKITGADLDILARRRLWEVGLDYNHGTGHGVGYFLNVHEGPQGISKFKPVVLEPGMNVTDEPGYYEENNFGIRIENVLIVKKTDLEGFLGFENVTMVPYDRNLIAKELLSVFEKDYIDAYHRKVFEAVSPILQQKNEVRALEWLREATLPL